MFVCKNYIFVKQSGPAVIYKLASSKQHNNFKILVTLFKICFCFELIVFTVPKVYGYVQPGRVHFTNDTEIQVLVQLMGELSPHLLNLKYIFMFCKVKRDPPGQPCQYLVIKAYNWVNLRNVLYFMNFILV